MVRRVAIYTRVSTLDQTIDNQLIELRDHCSKMGWVAYGQARPGRSGTANLCIPLPRFKGQFPILTIKCLEFIIFRKRVEII